MFICTTENIWNAHTAWGLAKLSPAIGWSDEGLHYQGESAIPSHGENGVI